MMKQNIKRMLPVLIIIGVTIGMSIFLYNQVLDREEKKCWQLLSDSAQSVSKEIEEKFKGNIAILRVVARTMSEENKTDSSEIQSLHLATYRKDTIFTRMEVIYPQDQIVSEDGMIEKSRKGITFQRIAKKGEHISHRMKDVKTGDESLYYYVPVKKKGKTVAVLTGVINAEKLSKEIKPSIYNGHAACLVVDSTDGNYIVDNWHKTLGNAYKTPHRKRLKKYENINLKNEVKQLKTGIIVFKSKTNGLDTYMYYRPIGIFNWELLVMTQETVIFGELLYLQNMLITAGIVEAVLLILYLLWNIRTVNQLSKSQEQLRHMSYRDSLTGLYNRNKYIDMIESSIGKRMQNTGIAYLDLNELKKVNDEQGHEAGDALICGAANACMMVFQNHAYRVGGDEFVIIETEIEEKKFKEKVVSLMNQLKERKISGAIGVIWEKDCNDLEDSVHKADEKMYQEKERSRSRA